MHHGNCPETGSRCLSWLGKGVRLEIYSELIGPEVWSVAVRNEYGVTSHWVETFDTAEAALDAAMQAIEEEGVEAFTSTEIIDDLLD
ncbi:MAG: hypothetical protein MRY76_08195 [Pseudomonadales bacterium]|nr:hypothetical protein [Pseudomonadales bacterium]